MEYLNHHNGKYNKIQFPIEIAEAGHHPFLDIDIYRKMDCSLGYNVYRKPTHKNLYLHQNSHQKFAQQTLSSLVPGTQS